MPLTSSKYRALVLGDKTTVQCGAKIDGCEGENALDIAWYVIADLTEVFGGEDWAEEFPGGFSMNLLTVEHIERAGLIVCGACKHQIEIACKAAGKDVPSFILLKKTVDDRANGRFQAAVVEEREKEYLRNAQAMEFLRGIPRNGGSTVPFNGNGKAVLARA